MCQKTHFPPQEFQNVALVSDDGLEKQRERKGNGNRRVLSQRKSLRQFIFLLGSKPQEDRTHTQNMAK